MSTEPIQPLPQPPQDGEFGIFLKNKDIKLTPLGKDAEGVEMIEIEKNDLVKASTLLKDSPETDLDFLVLITSLDTKKGYQSVYTLSSVRSKKSFRMKIIVLKDNPVIPSVSHIWSTADWYEREAYDMMGIKYSGHPNLKRILNPENWEGFPLRKDYIPPSDALNGPHPLTETVMAEKTLSSSH